MATVGAIGRASKQEWSVSQALKAYFCCFGTSNGSKRSRPEGDHARRDEIDEDYVRTDEEHHILNDQQRRGSQGSVHSSHKSHRSYKSVLASNTALSDASVHSGKSQKSARSRKSVGNNHSLGRAHNADDCRDLEGRVKDADGGSSEYNNEAFDSKSDKGSAYNYEDQDTSSDSDDEVLRRYQQSIQRVPSQRSERSAKSHKSTVSKKSSKTGKKEEKPSDQNKLMSRAEKGGKSGASSAYSSAGDSSDSEGKAPSHGKKVPSVRSGSHTKLSSPESAQQQESYDNAAFATEQMSRSVSRSPENVSHTSTDQALSGFGDTPSVSLGDQDEHLFDVSDLQDREPIFISKCGTLDVTFSYSSEKGRMTVTVHHCRDIPSKDRGGANNTQVRMLLLPTKKVRHKTKIKAGDNPDFQETFVLKVPAEEVNNMGVRLRLYGCERMRRERMIGESVVGFASLNQDTPTIHSLTLEPRSNLSHGDSKFDVSSLSRSDSASSTQSMQHGGMPELLSGLAYNGTTGRLSVEVIKGSNFKNMAMNRAPDTYVKLTLMSPTGQEIARSKTSIRRGQPNPLYKETFMFQVALFQLPDVTLMVSVYNKRSMKRKEMIGWFSCGYSNSSEEELAHWTDMRESKGEQVCRWHVLLEP